MDWTAIGLSLRLAAVTSAALLVIGVPIAAWLAFSRWRGRFLMEAVVALPLVLPPTVLGFYLLTALGPRSPLGHWWERLTGGRLVFSFTGLVVASILYSLPFLVQPVAAAFAAVDRRLIEASWGLGRGRLATFVRLVVPLSMRGLIAGVVLAFAHTLGEFGVVLMVGGNIAGVTRTASISIYDDVQAMDYGRAGATALALLGVSAAVLIVVYGFNGRGRRAGLGWPGN
jgi:molybdate transport system permease protein